MNDQYSNFNSNFLCSKGVQFFKFPAIENLGIVEHGFSTKKGGVSKGYYGEMNLSLKNGDDIEDVLENIRLFSMAVGVDYKKIVMSNQIHSCSVKCITRQDIGKGIFKPGFEDGVDSMITNVPGVVLMTFYADCVPIYLIDRKKKVISLIHSGWKGTIGNITRETISVMKSNYNTNPDDLTAFIGPSICRSCYEVGEDLASSFEKVYGLNKVTHIDLDGRIMLDLWEANKQNLLSSGVSENNITVSGICTCHNSELFHSHRANGVKRGLQAAIMSLKNDYE